MLLISKRFFHRLKGLGGDVMLDTAGVLYGDVLWDTYFYKKLGEELVPLIHLLGNNHSLVSKGDVIVLINIYISVFFELLHEY